MTEFNSAPHREHRVGVCCWYCCRLSLIVVSKANWDQGRFKEHQAFSSCAMRDFLLIVPKSWVLACPISSYLCSPDPTTPSPATLFQGWSLSVCRWPCHFYLLMFKPSADISAVKFWKLEGPPALLHWFVHSLGWLFGLSASHHVSCLFPIRHCFRGQIRPFWFFSFLISHKAVFFFFADRVKTYLFS